MDAVKQIKIESVVFWDLFAVLLFYLVPTLSHLTTIPLYKFEPIRCVLMLNFLLTGSKKNAYIMAVTLPLFSFLVGGHPVIAKSVIMAVEMSLNVFLFVKLSNNKMNNALAMFIAISASKVFYYLLKFVCIWIGIIETPLFATNLLIQLCVIALLSFSFIRYNVQKGSK